MIPRRRAYTVLLQPETEGAYTATVPSLPGVVTYGTTVEEALAMAKDAIELHIQELEADGLPVPEEDSPLLASVVQIGA